MTELRERVVREQIPSDAVLVCETLRAKGHGAWLVGGCVRDHLLAKPVSDWDVCTSATPDEVARCFKRVLRNNGEKHGTVTVMLAKVGYEVTTLRGEGAYSDGRRPDEVFFVRDLAEDLARRDFTVNAIAYDPIDDTLEDPFGGLDDLRAKVIRAVRDARERFTEDGLRVLRGARFVATLEFELDAKTREAIAPTLETFRKVSAERVHDEWFKTVNKARQPSRGFRVMAQTGILQVVFERAGKDALGLPDEATLERGLRAMDALPKSDGLLRLCALACVCLPEGTEPARAGAQTEALFRALKSSKEDMQRARHLVAHVTAGHPSDGAPAPELRRWMRSVELAHLPSFYALFRALLTAAGDNRDAFEAGFLGALQQRTDAILAAKNPLEMRDLAVNGGDLQRELGVPPSKQLGVLLQALLEAVLDDPTLNDRARLLERARSLHAAG